MEKKDEANDTRIHAQHNQHWPMQIVIMPHSNFENKCQKCRKYTLIVSQKDIEMSINCNTGIMFRYVAVIGYQIISCLWMFLHALACLFVTEDKVPLQMLLSF